MLSFVLKASALMMFVAIASGCNQLDRKLTRERAGELLRAHSGFQKTLSAVARPGEGCLTVGKDLQFRSVKEFINHLEFMRGRSEVVMSPQDYSVDAQAVMTGLLHLEMNRLPYDVTSAPSLCQGAMTVRDRYFYPLWQSTSSLLLWKLRVSRLALEAGVPAEGGTVLLYRRDLLGVTGLTERTENEVVAELSWQWLPTDIGKKLQQVASTRREGKALFRKYDDGWRLLDVDGI